MSQILLAAFGSPGPGPPQIANLLAWFKSESFDAITDGTDVATWPDVSGASRDMTAIGTAGDRPTVKRNSINTTMTSVQGVPTKAGLRYSSLLLSSKDTWTVFAVVYFVTTPSGGNFNIYFEFDGGLSTGMWIGLTDGGLLQITIPNRGSWISAETVSDSAWHYIVVKDAAATISVWVDGVEFTGSSPGTLTPSAPSSFAVFDNDTATSRGDVRLADVALFNSAVSDSDRLTNLEAYAQDRYGL